MDVQMVLIRRELKNGKVFNLPYSIVEESKVEGSLV